MTATFVEELTRFVSSTEWARRAGLTAPLRWAISTNGGPQFADNVILFGFVDGRRDPVMAVKRSRLGDPGRTLQNEFERLSELWDRLGDEAASLVPEPVALASLGGQPALLLSYVPGEVPWGRGGRSAPRSARRILSLAVEAAGRLRLVHQRTSTPLADQEHLLADLESKLRHFGDSFELTGEEQRALDELISVSRKVAASATHKVMSQGDFWSGNLIRPRGRGGLVILDWQTACWSADASLDVYFFIVEAALGAVRHAPPDERPRRAVGKMIEWRKDVVPAYLEAYGEPRGWGLLPPRLGMVRCCIEKSVRNRLQFGFSHPDDRIWRALFTEVVALAASDWPTPWRAARPGYPPP